MPIMLSRLYFVLLLVGLTLSLKCGQPDVQPITGTNEDRIVGGRRALRNSWPWQVSLQKGKGHYCGGVLINEQWVLTAAHCVATISSVNVTLGEHDLNVIDEGEMVIPSALEGIHVHPNYERSSAIHDIALVKLDSVVTFSKIAKAVCLPRQDSKIANGEYVYVAGWGYTGLLPFKSPYLKQAMVPVIYQEKCNEQSVRAVPLNSICTGFPSGEHNPCQGDSGSPLVHYSDGSWYVHGLVSWGPDLCGWTERPTVYVHVPSYIPWIQNILTKY